MGAFHLPLGDTGFGFLLLVLFGSYWGPLPESSTASNLLCSHIKFNTWSEIHLT